jgi:hypothetical protein
VRDVAAVALVVVMTVGGVPLALWALAGRAVRHAASGADVLVERVVRRRSGRPAWDTAGRLGRRGVEHGFGLLLARVRMPLGAALALLVLAALVLAALSGARTQTVLALALGLVGAAVAARLTTGVAGRLARPRRP